ncbi:hypothetical protein H311_01364 [Anncaliia algerae PRA109]|nr:hypothetical protein H311_01364 [Anncaliia algerae PRA109]
MIIFLLGRTKNSTAGIPESTPVMTINRQCASGLEAINTIASRIREGKIQIGLAGGFESISLKSLNTEIKLDEELIKNDEVKKCPLGAPRSRLEIFLEDGYLVKTIFYL